MPCIFNNKYISMPFNWLTWSLWCIYDKICQNYHISYFQKKLQKDPIYCIFVYLIINTLKCPPIDWMGHYNIFIIKYIKIIICPIFKKKKKQNIPDFHYFRIWKLPSIKSRTQTTICKPYSYAYTKSVCHHRSPSDWLNHIFIISKTQEYTHARVAIYSIKSR